MSNMKSTKNTRTRRQIADNGSGADNGSRLLRICVTIDQETDDIIGRLQRRMRTADRIVVVREILRSVQQGKISRTELRDFYKNTWALLLTKKHRTMARFNWERDLDDTLHLVSTEILGTVNKSEAFRMLVAFYAIREGVAKIAWTKSGTLTVPSR